MQMAKFEVHRLFLHCYFLVFDLKTLDIHREKNEAIFDTFISITKKCVFLFQKEYRFVSFSKILIIFLFSFSTDAEKTEQKAKARRC